MRTKRFPFVVAGLAGLLSHWIFMLFYADRFANAVDPTLHHGLGYLFATFVGPSVFYFAFIMVQLPLKVVAFGDIKRSWKWFLAGAIISNYVPLLFGLFSLSGLPE